jgi:hypothetical protein
MPEFTGCGNTPCPHYLPEVFDPGDPAHLDWAEWWVDALELSFSTICGVEGQLPGLSGEDALKALVAAKTRQDRPPAVRTRQNRRQTPQAPDFRGLVTHPQASASAMEKAQDRTHGTLRPPSGSPHRPRPF